MLAATALLSLFLASPVHLGLRRVTRIYMSSEASGLVDGSVGRSFAIECSINGCTTVDGPVDVALVQSLLDSLNQPALDHISLSNLGLTQEYLDALARGVRKFMESAAASSKINWREFNSWEAIVRNRAQVAAFLGANYDSQRFESVPSFRVGIEMEGGFAATLSSYSSHFFMLPWSIQKPEGPMTTFDARISRAVAALLPKRFMNRERMSGEELDEWVSKQAWQKVYDECRPTEP